MEFEIHLFLILTYGLYQKTWPIWVVFPLFCLSLLRCLQVIFVCLWLVNLKMLSTWIFMPLLLFGAECSM